MRLVKALRLYILLLFGLFCSCLFIEGCSKSVKNHPSSVSEDWNHHPALALSLSQAILTGMRQLLEQLFISELAFDGLDVSIVAGNSRILNARITDFALQNEPSGALVAHWRIYFETNKTLDYINTITFSNRTAEDKGLESSTLPDSLFLDIYQSTAKVLIAEGNIPSDLKVIYWRDVSKRDRLATLHMRQSPNNEFILTDKH